MNRDLLRPILFRVGGRQKNHPLAQKHHTAFEFKNRAKPHSRIIGSEDDGSKPSRADGPLCPLVVGIDDEISRVPGKIRLPGVTGKFQPWCLTSKEFTRVLGHELVIP